MHPLQKVASSAPMDGIACPQLSPDPTLDPVIQRVASLNLRKGQPPGLFSSLRRSFSRQNPIEHQRRGSEILTARERQDFQEVPKEKKLIQMILSPENNFWEKLILASDCIIPSPDLFSLIHAELSNSDESRTHTLLTFCQKWVETNLRTASFNAAIPQFEAICAWCEKSTLATATILGQTLLTIISTLPTSVTPKITPTHPRKQLNIHSIPNEENAYKALVTDVAFDCTLAQADLYCQMTPDTLIKNKWVIQPRQMREYEALFNQTTHFIQECIVSERDLEKRACIIKFFLDVADDCFNRNDCISARIIFSAFNTAPILRLKRTWDIVLRTHQKPFDRFEELFNPVKNFSVYRAYHKELFTRDTALLPDLTLVCKDVTFANENSAVTASALSYNFYKLDSIYDIITSFLKGQKNWIETRTLDQRTDFIDTHVAGHVIRDSEYYFNLSEQAEERLSQLK